MTRQGPWRPPAEVSGPLGAPPAGDGDGPDATPAPEEIHTAWVLWLVAAAFALAGMLLNVVTASVNDLPVATRDTLRESVESSGADLSMEAVFDMALVLGGAVGVAAAAVTVWLAFRLRAGRGWARTMLDIVGVFLVVDAMSVLIGVFGGVAEAGDRGDVVTFVVYSLQILAGLCAGAAVWRQHLPAATGYLKPEGSARGLG